MKRIFVRLDHCRGCHTCEMACIIAHSATKTLFSSISETTTPKKRLFVEHYSSKPVPVLCRHCDDSPCLNSCISGALWRDERGAVRCKKEKCIGCWTCTMVCPFGVTVHQLRDGRLVNVKCDLCDELESPACVDACPTKALVWADPDELSEKQRTGSVATLVSGSE